MSSGADKIVSNITSEAQNTADKIIQQAKEEVNSILEDGKTQSELEKNKILEDAKKQSDMRYQQIISEAKMNSRRLELEAREEVIEEAFNKATEELTNIASTNDTEYLNSLKNMIKEATIEIGGGNLVVLVKEEDISKISGSIDSIASEVQSELSKDTKLNMGEAINTIGGAILKTENGEIEVNNTIEARMLRFKKVLRSEVAKVLFS